MGEIWQSRYGPRCRYPTWGRHYPVRLMMGKYWLVAVGFVAVSFAALFAGAPAAYAHAFGERYDLPIPLMFYITGGGGVVVFSFVLVAAFIRAAPALDAYPRVNLLGMLPGRFLASPATLGVVRLISVAAFIGVLAAGLLGVQSETRNILPSFVWIIWWIGFAYISVLVGNLWALVNPWKIIFDWADAAYRRLSGGRELSLGVAYPRWLGRWPALVLFFAFAWLEIVWDGGAVPGNIAQMAIFYSIITWTGMLVFGKWRWLAGGEAFSVAFGLFSRFSPTEVRVTDPATCASCSAAGCTPNKGECVDCYECFRRADSAQREWNLRPYAVGLLTDKPIQPSLRVFVVLVLATVSFDGFIETPLWAGTVESIFATQALVPLLFRLDTITGDVSEVIDTIALVLSPILFLCVFLVVGRLMGSAAAIGGPASADRAQAPPAPAPRFTAGELADRFVLTLIPIAIAYHLAHYLNFFLVSGQLVIPLVSDPLGLGWNLFGTVHYEPLIGIVGAKFAWITAVLAIVAGHVVSVYLAHVMAVRVFADKKAALRSQYPMLVLMVCYTMLSLWILAQPITGSPVFIDR